MTLTIKEDISYLLDMADVLQKEATDHNIISVFDDGGYRELLLTKMFGLNKMAGRHGDDGIDEATGQKYELKTVNLIDTEGKLRIKPYITTCHHLNNEIIKRYRSVNGFLVGIFYINEPARIYEIHPNKLESSLTHWENRLHSETGLIHINNPKFSFLDIINNGALLYKDIKYDIYFDTIIANARITPTLKTLIDTTLKQKREQALINKEEELKKLKKAAKEI